MESLSTPADGQGIATLPPCVRDGTATLDLSTGTSMSGTTNAYGAADPKWTVVGPVPAGSGLNAVSNTNYSIMPYYTISGGWAAASAPATWINPWPGVNATMGVNGTYHYQMSFNIPAGYTVTGISGECRSDDGASFWVNGAPQACAGYNGGAPAFSSVAGPINPGTNVFHADVQNTGGGPTGLMMHATLTAVCRYVELPPKGDHYLCYDVNKPWRANPTLRDQFGTFGFDVYAISRVCNPVEKRINGQVYPIENPKLHYVCYKGKTRPIGRNVVVNNQFGSTTLKVQGPTELCLPSSKKEIDDSGSMKDDQR